MMRRLGIILLTYGRLDYAKQTLISTLENLWTDAELQVHIASDGDTPEYIAELREIAGSFTKPCAVTHSNSERRGYGCNYNLATQMVHESCDWVLPLEDDWVLSQPLRVDSIARQMEQLGIGCARLGYIGFTQELRCSFAYSGDSHWLKLDPESPEPHVFAGHPRLETREWERRVGPWPEGMLPGATEFEVAHNLNARRHVGWPISLIDSRGGLFQHIGTNRSY